MAEVTTYNTAGFREDLTNDVYRVSPEKTPILTMAKKGTASANYHEYQVDKIGAVDPTGALEGADPTAYTNQLADRAKIGNRVQEFRQHYKVSSRASRVGVAGPALEAESQSKAMVRLKNSIEARLASDSEMQVGTDSVADEMRGLGLVLDDAAQSVNPIDAAYRTPTAQNISTAVASLDIAAIQGAFESLYLNSGSASEEFVTVAGSTFRSKFSSLARTESSSIQRLTAPASEKVANMSVDIWDTDWGRISIVPSTFNALVSSGGYANTTTASKSRAYVIRPDMLEVAYLGTPFESIENPDLAGGKRGLVRSFCTLVYGNPVAGAKFHAA